ncbi:MAG TPA: phosphoadenosine phosphosulfate reductase family protein, partial [Nocardioidaceae bacterium]|nr:phosphoadenosine phosphosulfate reductase family protein [Nocardioidaceae bacterium]
MFRPGQRLYLQENVYDALLRRLRWLMTEFEGRVMLSSSGGKDSCVLFNMTLQVARELGCTPLRLMWIDQEAEWQSTVDIMRKWMATPDIKPMWHQLPHKIFNASTTVGDPWLHAWDPDAEDVWMHPRDPMAITENVYGTNRFHKLFGRILAHEFPGQTACTIAGVRCEESPNRRMALTAHETYKGETWGGGNGHDEGQFAFYPLYDWSYLDIWKAIHDHGWDYNAIYDAEYRYGIPVTEMRVSNLHHEAAVRWLFYVQEFEPDTYARLARRLPGIDMAGKLGK